MSETIPVAQALVFDSNKLKELLYKVAAVRLMANTTRADWSPYQSSSVLNALYNTFALLTLGRYAGPGFVEVETAPSRKLREQTAEYYPRLWKEFTVQARQGPAPMKAWLDRQQTLYRDDALYLQRIFLEARQINQQVDEQLRVAIFRLAEVRLVSEIALDILGLIPGGGAFGLAVRLVIGVGYPIFVNVLDDWNRAGLAQMTLSVALSSAATRLPDLATEEVAVNKAQFLLVDKPSMELLRLRNLRRMTGGFSSRAAKQAHKVKEMNLIMRGLGLKTLEAGLKGAACWFCYKACQENAEQFWRTLGELE